MLSMLSRSLLLLLPLTLLPLGAQIPKEKKVKIGNVAVQGILLKVEGSIDGFSAKLGTSWLFEPSRYALAIQQNGKEYTCELHRLEATINTGDTLRVTGKLVEVRDKASDSFKRLQIDGCKIESHSRTDRTQSRFLEGTITEKSRSTGLLAAISVQFKAANGKEYICKEYLAHSLEPTASDALMAREKLDAFSEYKVGDAVKVIGYPELGGSHLGACQITEHTQKN